MHMTYLFWESQQLSAIMNFASNYTTSQNSRGRSKQSLRLRGLGAWELRSNGLVGYNRNALGTMVDFV